MIALTARTKPVAGVEPGPPATITVAESGHIQIACDDATTFGWLSQLLVDRLFIQGLGFRLLQRDASGHLRRDPADQRFVVDRHVDLNAEESTVLQAICDGLEACEQFELSWED